MRRPAAHLDRRIEAARNAKIGPCAGCPGPRGQRFAGTQRQPRRRRQRAAVAAPVEAAAGEGDDERTVLGADAEAAHRNFDRRRRFHHCQERVRRFERLSSPSARPASRRSADSRAARGPGWSRRGRRREPAAAPNQRSAVDGASALSSRESRRVDPLESDRIADVGERHRRAPPIEHARRGAADLIPAGRHADAGDQRLSAGDEQRSRRDRRARRRAARNGERVRQAAKEGEAGRKANIYTR